MYLLIFLWILSLLPTYLISIISCMIYLCIRMNKLFIYKLQHSSLFVIGIPYNAPKKWRDSSQFFKLLSTTLHWTTSQYWNSSQHFIRCVITIFWNNNDNYVITVSTGMWQTFRVDLSPQKSLGTPWDLIIICLLKHSHGAIFGVKQSILSPDYPHMCNWIRRSL